MRKKNAPLTFPLRLIAGVLAGVVFLVIAVLILVGFTNFGANFAVREIVKRTASPDFTIGVGTVTAPLKGNFTVKSISVSDRNGQYLNVKDIEVDWSPLSLLRLRFFAENLSAQSVSMKRLPIANENSTTNKSTDGGSFSLPIGLEIAQFDFPQIDIDASIAGEDYPLAVSGHLDAVAHRVSATLDAEHRERPSTYLHSSIEYAPRSDRLDIAAELNEPQGGIVASLLQIPGIPALNIQFNGDGPLSNWSGNLTAQKSGKDLGSIDIRHKLADGNERKVQVKGSGQFGDLAPEPIHALLKGTTDLDVAIALSPSGRMVISKGNVTTGSLSLEASGTYAPKGKNDLKATLNGKNGALPFILPLGDDKLDLGINKIAVALSGDAENADFSASAELAQLTTQQGSASTITLAAIGKSLNLTRRTGLIDTTLTIGDIAPANETLKPLVKGPITIKAPVELTRTTVNVKAATLESGGIGGTVGLSFNTARQTAKGHIKLFALAYALPAAASQLIDGMIRVESDFTASASGDISLVGLQIANSLFNANGDVSLTAGEIDASLKAAFDNLSTLAPQVSGKAQLTMSAKGELEKPDINVALSASTLEITGKELRNLDLNFQIQANMAAPSGSLSATGTYAGAPLSLSANMASVGGAINIGGINGKIGNNSLSGDLMLNHKFLPAGGVNFDFPDLSLLSGLVGQKASGSLTGYIELDNTDNQIGLSVDAKSDQLTFNSITAQNLDADMTVADLGKLKANGKISIESVSTSGQTVSGITISAHNDGAATTVDLSASHDNKPINAEARVIRGDTLEIDLLRLDGSPMNIDFKLEKPGKITISNGKTDIQQFMISVGGGTINTIGSVGEKINLDIALNGVSVDIANQFIPNLGAEGTVSGNVAISGSNTNPLVEYVLQLNDADVAQNRRHGGTRLNATAKGRYENQRVTTDLTLVNGQDLNAHATGFIELNNGMPLNIAVEGRLPFALISSVAANAGFAVSGRADMAVVIGGKVSDPELSGDIDLDVKSITDIRRNLTINNVKGRLTLFDDQITLDGLSGNFSGGGTATIKGSVGITGGLPASIQVIADKAVINDGTLGSTTISGVISLDGDILKQPKLSGKLNLGRTAITIPERLPESISEIHIVHKNASQAIIKQAKELEPRQATSPNASLALDITVAAPSAIFVRGRGVDAELGGSVRVTGTTQKPIISGGFDLIRGRLSILSRRLDFTKGRATFGGAMVPIIDFAASTQAGSTSIIIKLEGLATDPQVSLSSSPPLPQDEILAQLLFQQSSSKLSALQIAQLADAVIQLTGGTSQSLFSSIREALGIDNLDLSTDDDGNTSVSVGKYLNNNTYVEIEQGTETGTKGNINIDIGRNFIVKGSADSKGEASGGVYYEREY